MVFWYLFTRNSRLRLSPFVVAVAFVFAIRTRWPRRRISVLEFKLTHFQLKFDARSGWTDFLFLFFLIRWLILLIVGGGEVFICDRCRFFCRNLFLRQFGFTVRHKAHEMESVKVGWPLWDQLMRWPTMTYAKRFKGKFGENKNGSLGNFFTYGQYRYE